MDISSVEKALLAGSCPSEGSTSLPDPVLKLARDVGDARFRDALLSPLARDLLQLRTVNANDPSVSWFQFVERVDDDVDEMGELVRLLVAIALLHAFIQANWTGPDLDVRPIEIIQGEAVGLTDEILHIKATSELAYGGEPAYHLTKHPFLLRLAQLLLESPYHHCKSIPWWRLRATTVHQHVLDETVAPPPSVLASIETQTESISSDPELTGRLHLEAGLLEHTLSQDRAASDYFLRAIKATGLQYELTGALGKRTKFQQNDLSQLVLLAESQLSVASTSETSATEISGPSSLPETLALNDDTLLEQTQFTTSDPNAEKGRLGHLDPSSQPPLHPLDQCILLSLCLNVQNTSPAHGLTAEQMTPYVARVISHPRNWSVHTMALLLRSRLESSRTRTVERATLQLQALIDQMPTADSSVPERLRYFHDIPLPSKWELERELALQFLKLGVVKSALEIFERLEMWEEVVKCWGSLDKPEKAKAIVRDLLEGKKDEAENVIIHGKDLSKDRRVYLDAAREAKLWCLLGDLEPENAVEHYNRAWDVSKQTSGRAMRSLGGYYFARVEYDKAIDCLKRAVTINPLLSRSWFILGCACVRVERWEDAKDAFSRCVAIDDEDGESWNNLASVYLRMGTPKPRVTGTRQDQATEGTGTDEMALTYDGESSKSIPFANKMLAFRALKQGLKYSYNNWRMWSNYMIVAMDVGELSEACRALGRIVEETSDKVGDKAVDEDVLERLVDAVTRAPASLGDNENGDASTHNPNEGHGLLRNVTILLEKTILPRVSSPRIFRAYARLLTWQSRWEDALKASLDAYRVGTAGTMRRGETDPAKWREAVVEVEEIVDVLRNFGPRVSGNWRLQAHSIVRTFAGRTKESFEDEPEWPRLEELREELKNE
ncbi:hypothetical protein PC9H_004577 [Pleurotus ostreatus]|uniref:TPR-like protein n=1 Tax=Pleurotus ostreatus TaxID=5322 RepID=A0A8H6ZVE5_PLEOS|nr:uncharacterized protein PC9H_004577 [Pleurotus ostreatus]KAF7432635.1 hypothetical protein PC9H_004577 [Pleurotus ostreatus]KAJ8698850.1 hypothetical protein PTI98_005515 [Pleurotus ostreatus]